MLLSASILLALLVGCVSPSTAIKIGSAKSDVRRLGTGKPVLDFNLANTNGLTKEQIAAKEDELFEKVKPALQKYEEGWTRDFVAATTKVKETYDAAPLVAFEATAKAYDDQLAASLASVGLKGTNSWVFPNGKVISRAEFVRQLVTATEKGIDGARRGASEIENSRQFVGNAANASLLLLGAAAGAAAQAPSCQPAYPIASPLLPHAPPTSATTYIGGGPQYGGYSATTIYH